MTPSKTLRLWPALVLAASAAPAVQAQNAATTLTNRATAAMCANCHGTDGRTIAGSAIPSLAGMPRAYMVQQLQAFKDGSRPATVMHQITKGLTTAQIDTIAAYYATIQR